MPPIRCRTITLFAGINSTSADELLPLVRLIPELTAIEAAGGIRPFHSRLGTRERAKPFNLLFGDSRPKLNQEATDFARQLAPADLFGTPAAPDRIGLLLVAPKTDKPPLPPALSQTELRQAMIWSPDDPVPNQQLFGGNLHSAFFDATRCHTTTVMVPMLWRQPYEPHAFATYLRDLPVMRRNPLYDNPPPASGNHRPPDPWVLSGVSTREASARPQDVLRQWLTEVDAVVIAHSQGCNIALAVLRRLLA